MTSYLLPILVFTVPVLAIVALAVSGRRLSGSCGGVGIDGKCGRCGRAAAEMPAKGEQGGVCP